MQYLQEKYSIYATSIQSKVINVVYYKMKKAALDKMKSGKDVIPEKPVKDWTEDKSLLDWLNGLKH